MASSNRARATSSKRQKSSATRGVLRAGARRAAASATADVIGVYKRITDIVWQRLSPTFGMRTINAIARNVIAKRAADGALALLDVGADGLLWDRLTENVQTQSADRLQQQLDAFIGDFFESLANLIGRLMVGKIFKEAEEIARQGEDR